MKTAWILGFLLALGAGIGAGSLIIRDADARAALAAHGLVSDFTDFTISSRKESVVKGHSVLELTGTGAGLELQATVLAGAGATFEHYTRQKLFQLASQFHRGESPYPGAVSSAVGCPAGQGPVSETISGAGWTGTLVRGFVDSRGLGGVCREEDRHRRMTRLILLCRQSGVVFDLTLLEGLNSEVAVARLREAACANGGTL